MRNLESRLKKLEGVGGKVYILFTFPFGATPGEQERLREATDNKYLADGGDPYPLKVFVAVQEFGNNPPKSKWFYHA